MKQRLERVNELIRREISDMLERDLRDSRFGMMTITEVRISKDLRYAKVFCSVYGDSAQKEQAFRMLKEKTPWFQREVGHRVRLRYTPALQFVLDETADKAEKIENLIKTLH